MRRYRGGATTAWLLTATSVVMLVGCSSQKQGAPSTSSVPTAAGAPSTAPVKIGISPGGVTTSLSAPASSTEDEYYQACHAATLWMKDKGGDRHAQIEPYLAMIQKSQKGEPGSWNTPWAKLPQERQAAVIVAVNSAADAGCE